MVGQKCRGTHFGCTDVYACVVYACAARLYACVAKLYVYAANLHAYVFMFISSHEHMPQHAYAYTGPTYVYTDRA